MHPQTTEDLEKVDQQRREEFKKYEMEKEFQRQQELAGMDEKHRKEAEKKHDVSMADIEFWIYHCVFISYLIFYEFLLMGSRF